MMEITRPTLVVDKEVCLNNIERMAAKIAQHKMRFRPHFKTHQSAKVGEWYSMYGVEAITVSSVRMAEYFAGNGWKDITIAFPLNILEINAMNRLAASIKLNVLIENREAAAALTQKATHKMGVFIKIDTGYHRTGIPTSQTGLIDSILEVLKNNKKLTFKGFLSHAGHTYNAQTPHDIFNIHFDALLKTSALRNRYQKEYPQLEISMGDTPSASLCGNFNGVDELRPGNFAFYDLMQHQLGACSLSDIAVRMICPVVAKHSSRNEVVIYGGAVHLSKEFILNTDGKPLFGRVILRKNGQKILLDTKNYLSRLSQEHGIIRVMQNILKEIEVGDLVEILPVHSCLTVNLMGQMVTSEGETIETMPRF